MRQYLRGLSVLILGIGFLFLAGCATCGTSYRRELSSNPKLGEANTSYKKAITWLDKAACSSESVEAERAYRTAESYISDAIFKLNKLGRENNIDVSEDAYYCERIKTETDVMIGSAGRAQ